MAGLTVVKLGGSFAFAEELPAWLDAIEAGAGKTVLVCGGGPFADAVRAAQPRIGFHDEAADAMALLAMEQYAIAIAATGRRFLVADLRTGIRAALRAGHVPVWAPRRMVRAARHIPASWAVTSDSLAVWLAAVLGARRLILVKRAEAPQGDVVADRLAKAGIVDAAFPKFLAASGVRCALLGPSDRHRLAAALRDERAIGRAVALEGTKGRRATRRRAPLAADRR